MNEQDMITKFGGLSKYLSHEAVFALLGRLGLAVGAIIVGMFVVRQVDKVAQKLMGKVIDIRMITATLGEKQRAEIRKQTLSAIAHHGLVIVGYLIVTLMTLDILGLDIRPILATAGVASLAIGFGAQNLVKDVISGFFIILEDQYGQGDIVDLDGDGGVVEYLGLRTTHLRNAEGVVIVKTNGSITVVRNKTKDWARIDFQVGVAYASDLTKVLEVLKDEGMKLKRDFTEDVLGEPETLGVESFGPSEVNLRMLIRVMPFRQADLKRELNRRVKHRFDKEGIEIPFPQRTVWNLPAPGALDSKSKGDAAAAAASVGV